MRPRYESRRDNSRPFIENLWSWCTNIVKRLPNKSRNQIPGQNEEMVLFPATFNKGRLLSGGTVEGSCEGGDNAPAAVAKSIVLWASICRHPVVRGALFLVSELPRYKETSRFQSIVLNVVLAVVLESVEHVGSGWASRASAERALLRIHYLRRL